MRLSDSFPPLGELAASVRDRITQKTAGPDAGSNGSGAGVRALSAEDLQHCLKDALERVVGRARAEIERLRSQIAELESEQQGLQESLAIEQNNRSEVEQLLREATAALESTAAAREELEPRALEAESLERQLRAMEEALGQRDAELAEALTRSRHEAERAEATARDLEEVRARLADALVEVERLRKELTEERTVELGTAETGDGAVDLPAMEIIPHAERLTDETVDLPACDLPLSDAVPCGEETMDLPALEVEAEVEALAAAPADVVDAEIAEAALTEEIGAVAGSVSATTPAPAVEPGEEETVIVSAPAAAVTDLQADETSQALPPLPPLPVAAGFSPDETVRVPSPVPLPEKHEPAAMGGTQLDLLSALGSLPTLEPAGREATTPAGGPEIVPLPADPSAGAVPLSPEVEERGALPTIDALFGRPRPRTARPRDLGRREAESERRGKVRAFGFGAALSTPASWRVEDGQAERSDPGGDGR
jgi:hypothetical protein